MSVVKVSIVVPCYNSGRFLEETLNSVRNQRFNDWECIIVNDGSTDNTGEVALRFATEDIRFKIIETPDLGLSGSRNAGIRCAKGEFILPLDGDDLISPDYVHQAVSAFENNPALGLVYCEAEFFEGKTGLWDLPPFSYENLAITNIIFCTALFRKQRWEEAGGYDESLKLGFEDYDFWLSILNDDPQVLKLPTVGFYYRVRANSLSGRMRDPVNYDRWKHYVIKKHYDFFARHLGDITALYVERRYYKGFTERIQKTIFYSLFLKVRTTMQKKSAKN